MAVLRPHQLKQRLHLLTDTDNIYSVHPLNKCPLNKCSDVSLPILFINGYAGYIINGFVEIKRIMPGVEKGLAY
jgi:hypothetical protein